MQENQKPKLMDTSMEELCAILLENGLEEGLPRVFSTILNAAMKIERSQAIGALPYERSENRLGQSNGFKPKMLKTRVGLVPVSIPQVRGMTFYPKSLERGQRSERALKAALAQMYIQGVSTRKVTKIVEELCGLEVTSSQVSRLCSELDTELKAFRERDLGSYAYVYLDARYEKVRYQGQVRDLAVLWAIGINPQGHREVLGVHVSLSEAEVYWRAFLESLKKRGLNDLKLIISDDHSGLKAARISILGHVPWQRCQFHLSQNAQSYARHQEQRKAIADDLKDVFASQDPDQAHQRLQSKVEKYQETNPRLAQWMEENVDQGLTVLHFPKEHQRRLRTSNVMERSNKEIKRRTRVATLFPNQASCLRLVSSVLLELHEEWVTGKKYLSMDTKKIQLQNQNLRKEAA